MGRRGRLRRCALAERCFVIFFFFLVEGRYQRISLEKGWSAVLRVSHSRG